MTRFFLDCEWADKAGRELVSLALISEDDQHRFYSEVDPLPKHPTDWVNAVVYPLLEHGFAARRQPEFTTELRRFLVGFDNPWVLFDSHYDGALLHYALNGFNLPDTVAAKLGPRPNPVMHLIQRDDLVRHIERYFQIHIAEARRRHHAGVDAEALRWAYLQAFIEPKG